MGHRTNPGVVGGTMSGHYLQPMLWALAFLSFGLNASADEMAQIIKNIHSNFADYYAPKQWKTDTFTWNLDEEIAKLNDIGDRGDINAFQQSLNDFFKGTRDYHTKITFAYDAVATLPLSIKYIGGEFYVAYVAPGLIENFALQVGDKVIAINDLPVKDVAHKLMGKLNEPSLTDWALAARKLTRRAAAALDPIEKGTVIIKALRGEREVIAQTVWDVNRGYRSMNVQPQAVRTNRFMKSLPQRLTPQQKAAIETAYKHIDNRSFRVSFADLTQAPANAALDPSLLGNRESFLPELGERVIWKTDSGNPWVAYVYMNDDNKLVGFIRIPSYVPDESFGTADVYIEKLGAVIDKMNAIKTDMLVIDQLNNPGGSVFYLYTLVSMLTDKPVSTPRHRFTIDSKDVWDAKEFLKQVDSLIAVLQILPIHVGSIEGYPIDLQFILHMKSYFQFVVDQWSEGKTLTDPYFLYGVDYIQPHAQHRFTKPIMLLTNELDFSGGDFFPAILQDNQRATILGTKTAGAGGYVLSVKERNRSGILSYSYTGSIALRSNGQPLENLGVAPDIEYQISPEDLMSGYLVFKEAINAAVTTMLK